MLVIAGDEPEEGRRSLALYCMFYNTSVSIVEYAILAYVKYVRAFIQNAEEKTTDRRTEADQLSARSALSLLGVSPASLRPMVQIKKSNRVIQAIL
jgi:hypothetical protein